MDGFRRSVSPSPSVKRSSIQYDENEENRDQIRADMQNPKQPMTTKNYMSSTISASSKAITPRKKILAEKNEGSETIFPDEMNENSVHYNARESLCSKQEQKSPQVMSQLSGDEVEKFESFKPYDPITNFLSPRPQFLRYNPNRRREIFGDREDGKEETEDELVSRSSSSSSLITGEIAEADEEEIKGGNEELEASEKHETEEEFIEEEEEEEEVKGGYFSEGRMKNTLFLLVLGLSAALVIYVNCSTSSGGLRFQKGIEFGNYETGNHSLKVVLVENLESGNDFLHQGAFGKGVEKGNVIGKWVEKRDSKHREWSDELKSSEDSVEVAERDDLGEVAGLSIGDIEEASNQVDGDTEYQEGPETMESIENDELETEDTSSMVEHSKNQEVPKTEESIENHELETEVTSSMVEHSKNQEVPETDESIEDDGPDSYASNLFEDQHETEVNPVEVKVEETSDETVWGSITRKFEYFMEYLKQVEAETALKFLIGGVTISTAVGFIFLGLKPKLKKKTAKKESQPIENQNNTEYACSSSLPDHTDQVYSFTNNLSSPIHSSEEETEEFLQSHAPSVEFLGEFVVKEIKSFREERLVSSHSEFSFGDSPSYGSYCTAEKKAAKKEFCGDGEARALMTPASRGSSRNGEAVGTTPLRRSSRIRSLSIKSP